MAKETKIDARGMKDEEIAIALSQYRTQMMSLRTQAVTEKVEDNSQFTKVRRNIARLQTERRARLAAQSGARPKPVAPAKKAVATKAASTRKPAAKGKAKAAAR